MMALPRISPRPDTLLELVVLFLPSAKRSPQEDGTRVKVFQVVKSFPGLHQREIARQLELRASHAEHHLRYLERTGLVSVIEDGVYRRYYARTSADTGLQKDVVGAVDKRVLAILRQKVPLAIVGVLLKEGPTRLGDLAQAVRVSPGTLTYQMKKLDAAGLVEVEQDGRFKIARLVQADATATLLLQYAPTDDLVEGFEDLWSDLGF